MREDTGGERLRCWIGRFEDHQPQATEGGLDEASERLGCAGAGPIGFAQGGQKRFGEGRGGEHSGELGDCLLDAFVEGQSRDRKVAGALGGRQRDAPRMERRVEHRTSRDLFPVVILGIHPEDRHHGHVVFAGDAPGQLDGGDRLQQRVHRATERPGLLPGQDGDGLGVRELRDGRPCLGRRVAARLLCREHVHNLAPVAASVPGPAR